MSTVVAVPAEAGTWSRRIRAWAREEDAAFEALVEARSSGDLQLVERARRTHSETYHRAPTGRRQRRSRL